MIGKYLWIVNKIDRSSLLKYKIKEPDKDRFKLRFFKNFDLNYITLKNNILNDFNLMKNKFEWLIDYELQFSNSISNNLNSILIDNFNSNLNESSHTRQCNKLNCKGRISLSIYKIIHSFQRIHHRMTMKRTHHRLKKNCKKTC